MENRTTSRIKSFLGAKIVMEGGFSLFDCIVKDISASGALLKVQNSISVPDTFRLVVCDGRNFDVMVQWRRIDTIGVRFANSSIPQPDKAG